jgi:hypothetical protein
MMPAPGEESEAAERRVRLDLMEMVPNDAESGLARLLARSWAPWSLQTPKNSLKRCFQYYDWAGCAVRRTCLKGETIGGVCVYYCRTYYKAVRVGEGG